MRLSDLTSVMTIEQSAFPAPWRASAYEYELTSNRLASYQVLTVREGDRPAQVIGYAGYWLLVDEAHVSTIAVSGAWRGRGLGELLLLSLLNQAFADEAILATLEVRKSNTVAQALYRKYRFVLVGERRRYYQGKEDALLMTVEPLDRTYREYLRNRQRMLFERLVLERPLEV